MQVNKNQIFSLLSIVCLILLIRNAILLKLVEPQGYVIDIYSMFPLSFYAGLVVCYLLGAFLVINGKKIIGLLILSINHLEILMIPYMVGYYSMGRADDMTYIGEYLHIANSGHFSGWNIYPASHTIGAGISIISNIEPHLVSFIIPIVFSFLFIAGIYLFSRNLFPDPDIKSLVIVSSFILYLGVYNFLNVPHALFFAYLPLFLYVMNSRMNIRQTGNLSFPVIFVLMTLMIPYSHPFVVFFIMILFLFHVISAIPSGRRIVKFRIPELNANALILLFVAFLSWFFYQGRLVNDLIIAVNSYIGQIGREPTAVWTAEKLNQIQFGFFDYLQLFTFYYGRYVIPTIIIMLGLIYTYLNRNILSEPRFKNYRYLLTLYVLFVVIQIIFLLNPIIIHQPDRIMNLNFVVYAQIPLFAITLYIIFLNKSKSVYNILLVCIVLTSIWSVSFFGAFDSPRVYRPNAALAYNEVEGMSWFADSKGDYPINMMFEQSDRYTSIFDIRSSDWIYLKTIPDHFGYEANISTFSEVYFDPPIENYENGYLAITKLGKLLYQELPAHKRVGRFREKDFETIANDPSVNKIYDSLDIDIYMVNNSGG